MWEQIRSNQRKSAGLVVIMAAVLVLLGYLLGEIIGPGLGPVGLGVALILWGILTLISFYQGDKIFLRLSRASRIRHDDHPTLWNIVEEMKIASGLPKMPDIYIIDDAAPNAFATGRSAETASIAVTTGLLELLTRDELQGVVAHEMAHIKNKDSLLMMMVGIMMGAVVMLADIGLRSFFYGGFSRRRTSSRSQGGQAQLFILLLAVVLMILAPLIAHLIYFAVSRRKEYLADSCAALYTRYPPGLADALEKIGQKPLKLRAATRATAPMYIVNPLKVTQQGLANLSSTHPPLSERIQILRAMAGSIHFQSYDAAYRKVTGRVVGILPKSVLSPPVEATPLRAQSKHVPHRIKRIRETTDMMWKLKNYHFATCPCGMKLKIPPAYHSDKIRCPRCHKQLELNLSEHN